MKSKLIQLAAMLALLAAGGVALAQDIQERTIRFGHLNNPDHPTSTGVKKFAELVAAKSGGKIKVQEYPSSQLGNELQQQSALQGGVQEMLVASTTSLAGIVKEFGLFDFPFLFSNAQQADAMVDGPLGKMLSAKLAEKGVVVLGFFDLGFRNVTNSKRPDHQGRGPGRPEAARDPEPGVPGNLQDLQGEPDADALCRAVRRARKQGRGRAGEPVLGDPVEQVLRGEQVRQRHQPRVRDQPHPDQQALLGQAVAGGAEAAAGRRHRSARTTSAWSAARPPARPWPNSRPRAWCTTTSHPPSWPACAPKSSRSTTSSPPPTSRPW